MPAKPISIIAQVEGSGVGAASQALRSATPISKKEVSPTFSPKALIGSQLSTAQMVNSSTPTICQVPSMVDEVLLALKVSVSEAFQVERGDQTPLRDLAAKVRV
jgi:hypothetical protein